MEQFARQDQQLLERLVTAVENADGDVFIDGKVLLGFVGRGQRGETRREMVAAGRATRWRQ